MPWFNTFNSSELEVIEINQNNIGYYQTNTCEFNLIEVVFHNIQNLTFEIKEDLSSDVECHGKINGMDLIGDNIKVYFGTNLNIDLIVQSLFWLFCLNLIPKSGKHYSFNYKLNKIGLIMILFFIHLIGNASYYEYFSKTFSTSLESNNFLLFSLLATKVLILLLLIDILKTRVFNLINYFPFLFFITGAFNSFNLNFFIILLIFFGIESLFLNKKYKNFTISYFSICSIILVSKIFADDSNNNLFLDVDKLKGFTSSNSSIISLIYWIILFYLIVVGFYYLFEISKDKIDLSLIKDNLLKSGFLITSIGVLSSINPVLNFISYYYLGLNKYGMKTFDSISGNTWRGISPSAEAVGEYFAYIILFFILLVFNKKSEFQYKDILLLLIISYGLYRSNNFAAVSSLIVLILIFIGNKFLNINLTKKIILFLVLIIFFTSILFYFTPYSTQYLSKAMLYHGLENSSFDYELPKNQYNQTFVELTNFGEALILEDGESNISNSLYRALEIYNDGGDIKYLPNPVTIVSAISVPINRSEKWGIFLAKYNPSFTQLLFGYGPYQLVEYYKIHPTKVNSGLVLPHSSLLDFLIFFGIFGIVAIGYYLFQIIKNNNKNLIFTILMFFLLINLLKSDSLLYFSNLILLLFTINLGNLPSVDYDE